MSGCASTSKMLSTVEKASNDSYGYSVENPILMGQYHHWQKNTNLAHMYLSKLKYERKPLKLIAHATVKKPENQPRKNKSLPLRYGTPASLGGDFLDLYILVPRGTKDTLNLYIDVEIEGEIKIPKGFEFNINQENNIYR